MGTEDLLGNLNERIRACRQCNLADTRTNALCGEGNLQAELMLRNYRKMQAFLSSLAAGEDCRKEK